MQGMQGADADMMVVIYGRDRAKKTKWQRERADIPTQIVRTAKAMQTHINESYGSSQVRCTLKQKNGK
jgi:hypothetical protein